MDERKKEAFETLSRKKEENPGILNRIRMDEFSLKLLTKNYPELEILKDVPQNPQYHGEGDVYKHTELVCQEILKLKQWSSLTWKEQELLFLAGAFHDIGKASCTRLEEGTWTSPRHTIVGEKVFRAMAYREGKRFGLTWEEREIAAKLIRFHGLPVWFWKKKRPEFELLKTAESVPMKLLYLLSLADVKGRDCREPESLEEHVELFWDYAQELGVSQGAYPFANQYTKYQFFHKDSLWQGNELYDNTKFEVWLMSGLPLAGKDTWIKKYGEGRAVISLDDIREEYGISPKENSSKVVQIAVQRAKKFLQKKESFIWNATNIIEEIREKLCGLFSAYGARVRILYLEVPYEELLHRNEKRERYIPIPVLERMIDKLEIPAPWEGHLLEVICNSQNKSKNL